jgi:hypothetical protein
MKLNLRRKAISAAMAFTLISLTMGSILYAAPPVVEPFPIGIHVPPSPAQTNDAAYGEIEDLNANVIVGGNNLVTKTTNGNALNFASAHGIKILVDDWGFHWKTDMLRQYTADGGLNVRNDNRLGQTITTPTYESGWILERVELTLDGTSCPTGASMAMKIYTDPSKSTLIASSSTYSCSSAFTHPEFAFPASTSLATNTSYYIELFTASTVNIGLVKTSTTDVYAGGQAYVNGVAQSKDLTFEIRFYQAVRPYSSGNVQSTSLLDDLAEHYKTNPNVLGYNLWDEPSSELFAKIEDAVDRLHQEDPDHSVRVNLFPYYATSSQLGMDLLASDTVTSAQPAGQTFRTALDQSNISTIQVWLDTTTFSSGESLTLALWDSTAKTTKLAEQTLTSAASNWPQFTLNATVTPNTNYYWELTHNGAGDNSISLKRSPTGSNWNNDGTGYKAGVALDADLWFTLNQNLVGGSYEDYVYRWASKRPDFLLFDYYPFLAASDRLTYFDNLEVIRRQSLSNHIHFWSYIQSFTRSGYRFPNENEIKYSIYSNLAYGARGYIFYTYESLSPMTGLILSDGTKHASFNAAKTINAEVLKLGPTLNALTSEDVYHTGTLPSGTVALPSSFFWQPTDPTQPLIVGSFINDSGRKYVMVVNRDYTNSRTSSFTLPSLPLSVTEVSKTTGLEVSTNYNSGTGILSSDFAPGEGRLYAITEDTESPRSEASLQGAQTNDWFSTDVIVGLSALDNSSSVAGIVYKMNDANHWSPYQGPILINENGQYQLAYKASDHAGNTESAKSMTINVDKQAPVAHLTRGGIPFADGTLVEDADSLAIQVTAEDEISGLDSVAITLDGQPYSSGSAILVAGNLGIHHLLATSTDRAGNVTNTNISFQVHTSLSSLRALIDRYATNGTLNSPLLTQLRNKLDQAEDQLQKDHTKQAVKHMEDFLDHLNKSSMQAYVTPEVKEILTVDATALKNSW